MKLARKLNAFDATLIVAGGIIGAGIFRNPSVVAQRVHTTPLIFSVWIFGGIVALLGGFIFAELAWRRPASGGLYGYMRDAFHPSVAFMYGWTALWVSQSGGMAAAAVTFAAYIVPMWGNGVAPWIPAAGIIAALSAINCFGVR
ncbi:MAG: amino acid permease [Candidatus Eremiobacteraeota bacterium]|nr:amino acid permease [Candidatus Eremiobacteraeota bacterium]